MIEIKKRENTYKKRKETMDKLLKLSHTPDFIMENQKKLISETLEQSKQRMQIGLNVLDWHTEKLIIKLIHMDFLMMKIAMKLKD